jgi:hypothetical protein
VDRRRRHDAGRRPLPRGMDFRHDCQRLEFRTITDDARVPFPRLNSVIRPRVHPTQIGSSIVEAGRR